MACPKHDFRQRLNVWLMLSGHLNRHTVFQAVRGAAAPEHRW